VVGDIEFLPEAFALKGEELEDTTALMFGRRSYEAFAPLWRDSDDHVTYKELPKYVVSTTLPEDALIEGWGPTTILRSTEDVVELETSEGGAIFIHGSSELARRLSDVDLIDLYTSRTSTPAATRGDLAPNHRRQNGQAESDTRDQTTLTNRGGSPVIVQNPASWILSPMRALLRKSIPFDRPSGAESSIGHESGIQTHQY
jgi:dihydrofolate reductase